MSIEKGSKWVKDGEVYTVSAIEEVLNPRNDTEILVWFSDGMVEYYAITQPLFLEQYKPYKPVYEWEFVAQQPNGYRHFTKFMTEKEMEHFSFQNDCAYYQRLDFTKRERKPL